MKIRFCKETDLFSSRNISFRSLAEIEYKKEAKNYEIAKEEKKKEQAKKSFFSRVFGGSSSSSTEVFIQSILKYVEQTPSITARERRTLSHYRFQRSFGKSGVPQRCNYFSFFFNP